MAKSVGYSNTTTPGARRPRAGRTARFRTASHEVSAVTYLFCPEIVKRLKMTL